MCSVKKTSYPWNSPAGDHLLYASDQGIEDLAFANVVATLLPMTAFSLKEPYARGRYMIDHPLCGGPGYGLQIRNQNLSIIQTHRTWPLSCLMKALLHNRHAWPNRQ
jgi:hypothetical protein